MSQYPLSHVVTHSWYTEHHQRQRPFETRWERGRERERERARERQNWLSLLRILPLHYARSFFSLTATAPHRRFSICRRLWCGPNGVLVFFSFTKMIQWLNISPCRAPSSFVLHLSTSLILSIYLVSFHLAVPLFEKGHKTVGGNLTVQPPCCFTSDCRAIAHTPAAVITMATQLTQVSVTEESVQQTDRKGHLEREREEERARGENTERGKEKDRERDRRRTKCGEREERENKGKEREIEIAFPEIDGCPINQAW